MSTQQGTHESRRISVDRLIQIAVSQGEPIAYFNGDRRTWTLFELPDGSGILVRRWWTNVGVDLPSTMQDADQLTPAQLMRRRALLTRMGG